MTLRENKKRAGFFRVLLPVVIIVLAIIGAQVLIATRPTVPKTTPIETSTFVNVLTARLQNERAMISAFGTVKAYQELTVQPEVSGRVIAYHPDLIAGGVIPKGTRLLRIDPRDFQVAVEEEKAALAKAKFDIKVELGNQAIAQREWDLLKPSSGEISELSKQLALRYPHLQEKRAALSAAKSRLQKAQLDLRRTVLTAPFDAVVLSESVEVGQMVNVQNTVATLVGTNEFRAQVSIPIHQLDWITFPTSGSMTGARARIFRELGNEKPLERNGVVVDLLGEVTQNGRMAQVLISIPDPLDLSRKKGERHPLLLGEYVRVEIEGPMLENVMVLPRSTIREGSRVWVKNQEKRLEVRTVKIAVSRKDTVVISQGLNDGDQVIVTQLPAAIPGLKLISAEDETSAPSVE
ncbi:MAG: efflux RND transporter periplasmic adaptor subunit, partial [Nitrospirales bacterium]